MSKTVRILIVEDLATDAELARHEIGRVIENCEFRQVETRQAFLQALGDFQPDVILSDFHLPNFDGMKALKLAQERAPFTPLIIWTGSLSEDIAVDCMKAGANNYVIKDNMKRLGPAVIHALEERHLLLERRQAEENYRVIFENSPEGIFQASPEGRFIKVNPAMARIYGYDSPEEMIESVTDIAYQIHIDPDERTEFIRLLETKGIVENFEGRHLRRDGSIILTSTSARAVRDASGVVLYYEGFLQDITARKQVEESLQKSERRFRALIENGLDNISFLAADGSLIWEGPAIFRTLDYTPDELVGRNIFELLHPEDLEWTRAQYAKLVQEPGSRQRGIFRLRHSSGTWRWVEAIVTNMLDDPSVGAIVVNYRDVTERMHTEEALRRNEAILAQAGKMAHLGAWEVEISSASDVDAGNLRWSDEVYRIFGYEPREVEVTNALFYEHVHPDDRRKVADAVDRAIAERRAYEIEHRIIRTDGVERVVLEHADLILNEHGQPVRMLGAVQDITERKRVEDQLRESENRLVMAMAGAQMSVWEWDLQTNGIFWSSELFELTGVDQEGFDRSFESFANLIHPEDVARVKASAEKALAEQSLFSEEFRILRPDGEIRWLSNLGHAEYDSVRRNLRLIGTIQDITKRKQAEMERQTLLEIMQGLANTKDLQEFLKLIHQSIARVIYAENFSVIFYNRESGLFEEIYSVDKYDPPAPPSKLEKSITSYVFRTGEPLLLTNSRFSELVAQGEVELVGTNSESWLGAPLNTPGGTIGVMAVQDYENPNRYSERDRDFLASIAAQVALAIERRRAEELLQQREQHLKAIIENEPDCIKLVAPDGSLLQMNPAGLAMIEADSPQAVLGKSVYPLVAPEHRQAFRDLTERVCRGESGKLEFEIVGLKGTHRWLETHAVPMRNEQGEPIGLLGITRDFTERRRTEEELRAAEVKYRTLVEHIAAITYIAACDEAKTLLYVSPQIETSLGFTQSEYLAEAGLWEKLLHPDDRGRVLAEAKHFYETGEPFISEYRSLTRDGRVVWFHDEAIIFKEETSGRSFIQGVKIDITERKRTEAELRASEERFRQLADNIQEVFWMTDAETGEELYMSSAAEAIWGHPTEYLMHQPNAFIDSVLPEDRPAVLHALERERQGERVEIEYRITRPDGSVRWIRDRAFPIHDDAGKVRRIAGISADITGQKQAEEALQASEKRFRALIENSIDVIALLEADGCVTYVTPGVSGVLGYSADELVGTNGFELIHPEDAGHAASLISQVLQTPGATATATIRERHKDGSWRWLEGTITNLLPEPSVRALVTNFHDVTERRRAEEETRRHLAELEALYENGLAVGRLLKPDEIGDRIIETFARYLSWHHVAIRLKRPGSDELELIALNQPGLSEPERAALEQHSRSMVSTVDQGLSGWVTQTGVALRTGNVHAHSQYVATFPGIRSGLYMPLKVGEQIIGSISVESEVADAFTAQDERLLATLANQAAIAFENARLYQSTQQELAERRRLQEQLNREHAQLKVLFETIPDPIWLKDSQGRYLACNPVFEQLIEVYEQDILGKTDDDLLDESLAAHFRERDQEAIARNVPMTYQEWVAYPNKQPRLMETVRTPMRDDKGNLIGVLGISHDITAMYDTQQELRESQELYRLLVETSPDGIAIFGLDGSILFANQQLADLFGMKNAFDFIGLNFEFLVDPQERSRIRHHFEEAARDKVSLQEYRMVRKDGSHFYGETRSSLSLDETGQARWIISQIRDITESRTAQETIREERQRFLDLFENAPVAIWLEDFTAVMGWMEQLRVQGVADLRDYLTSHPDRLRHALSLIRVLSVNQAAVKMNAARSKEHLLEEFQRLVRDETPLPIMIHELDMLWKGQTSFEFEMSSRRLDGTLLTGILHVYIPMVNGSPDYARVIIASTDISERVNTEKALQASEAHYRELADSITDVFFEMDHELRYIYWNKASEALTGIPASEAIGKSMTQIFGETEEQARLERIYARILKGHQPKTFETVLGTGTQQQIFEINAYPSMRGVSVVAKDVTDRKRLETLMQKRLELMEYAAKHSLTEVMQRTIDEACEMTESQIGFFHLLDGDESTIGMQTWSTSAVGLANLSGGKDADVHRSADQAGVWAEAIRQRRPLIQNNYELPPETTNTPDGDVAISREMVIPIIRNEKIVAVIGLRNKAGEYTKRDLEIVERFADYAWDVTERKQMEMTLADERNQLAQRVEERTADLIHANSNLARALRVKDEFLANMSHELRTPLNAILGLSESLMEQTAGPLNEKQQKYIATISESGHHLLSLINDILDLAKIEAGQIKLDINRVDISSVCQASLRMIRQLAQKKNQEVTLAIDSHIGLIWADERRLKQMIVNLLSNAVKFTPEGGKIGLEVHGNEDQNEVMITVWDNGIGMQKADLSRLFQPFVQLDSGLARETTGTGLGLALVAQMVRLHGGSVRVESHPDEGSRFTIVLPWEPALAPDTTSRMKITGKFRAIRHDSAYRPTILLIEDTNEVIMMIRDYLELAGYQVATARDGVEGIAKAKLIHPDLILMDVMMPRMDGLETTRRLRSEPDFEDTPIIAVTALAMPSDRERCIAAGMNDYMSKPVNLKELVKSIQRFLRSPEEAGSR